MGNPRRLVLHRADPQARIAIKDARENHRRQRVANPVVTIDQAGRGEFVEVKRELTARNATAWGADMEQQGHIQVLRRPPQTIVDRVTVGPVGQRIDRDESPHQPQLGTALQLLAGRINVVHIQHADALEARGRGLAEVRDPMVVRDT